MRGRNAKCGARPRQKALHMTTQTMTLADQLTAAAAAIGGKAWGAEKGKPRIYLQMRRRDVTAYFSFPDADAADLGGAKLEVYIEDCGQSGAWYASQKEKIRSNLAPQGLVLIALRAGHAELAEQILDRSWTADQIDQAADALLNGRLAEVIAMLAKND